MFMALSKLTDLPFFPLTVLQTLQPSVCSSKMQLIGNLFATYLQLYHQNNNKKTAVDIVGAQ